MFARITVLVLALLLSPLNAVAHQPVVLNTTDTTASKGPLLTDGTISFAVRAAFTKSGERRAFRAAFKSGDTFSIQYLIFDKKPDNALRTTLLPSVLITSPSGKKVTLRITERTKFYEPYSATNYLYLARNTFAAEAGIYSILITSRGKAEVTVAIGDREVPGEVVRGTVASPTASPSASTKPTSQALVYTMELVKQNNNASSCWSVIDGNVYDLTKWINSHPGGSGVIRSLCGTDGTTSFKAQHGSQDKPNYRLESFLLGKLVKS
ncbi:MAG: cytochrome b5 domain-containing protein [Candidatus Nanopelagicaceae bacterium]|jgi:hypothetical protein